MPNAHKAPNQSTITLRIQTPSGSAIIKHTAENEQHLARDNRKITLLEVNPPIHEPCNFPVDWSNSTCSTADKEANKLYCVTYIGLK